jgi:hypothetical protein
MILLGNHWVRNGVAHLYNLMAMPSSEVPTVSTLERQSKHAGEADNTIRNNDFTDAGTWPARKHRRLVSSIRAGKCC